MSKLQKIEYPVFFTPYIEILDEVSSLLQHLETSLELFEQILYEVDDEKYEYRYEAGKWTLKEVVQHLIDAERIFVYRSLRFSRKDATPLMGYEENSYVSNYEINKQDFNTLFD